MDVVTAGQLLAAALAPDDVGPGFRVLDEGERTDPLVVERYLMQREPDNEQVIVVLRVEAEVEPDEVAAALAHALATEPPVQTAALSDRFAPEWLAAGAVGYRFTGLAGPWRVSGLVYAWRQGPVIASLVVMFVGADDDKEGIADRYAELQRDKLIAALAVTPADQPPPKPTP